MSQSTITAVLEESNKETEQPVKMGYSHEIIHIKGKEMPTSNFFSKKASLGEISAKRLQKETLLQELIDCLENKKQQVQKLQEIIRYKDKTIRLLQKRHIEFQKSLQQMGRLQTQLQEKTSNIEKLVQILKNVSEKIQKLLKINKYYQTQTVNSLLLMNVQSFDCINSQVSSATVAGFNCQKLFNLLGQLELHMQISGRTTYNSLSKLQLSPKSLKVYVQSENIQKTLQNDRPQETKLINLKDERDQLKQLLRKTQKVKEQLANKVELEYLRIKSEIKTKSLDSSCYLDDMATMIQKIERQDKVIQQYAIELVKVRNDFTEQTRETLNKIKKIQKNHLEILLKKDKEIQMLMGKMQSL